MIRSDHSQTVVADHQQNQGHASDLSDGPVVNEGSADCSLSLQQILENAIEQEKSQLDILSDMLKKLELNPDQRLLVKTVRIGERHLEATLKQDELAKFLEYIKPLALKSHCETVYIPDEDDETIALYTNFFDGTSVNEVSFVYGSKCIIKDNFDSWADLVQKMRPSALTYSQRDITYTRALILFLTKSAEVVDTISIVTFAQEATTSENAISLNVVQIILSKKCCTLHIGDEMSKVSHSDVEKLIAFFGSLGKKVSLAIPTDGSTEDGQLDEYRLQTTFFNKGTHKKDRLLIEHIDMHPKAEDDEVIKMLIARAANPAASVSFENVPEKDSCVQIATYDNQPFQSDDIYSRLLRKIFFDVEEYQQLRSKMILEFVQEMKCDTKRHIFVTYFSIGVPLRFVPGEEWELHFHFDSFLHQMMWQMCLSLIFSKLGTSEHAVSIFNKRESRWDIRNVTVQVNADNFGKAVKYLKPLADKTHIRTVSLKDRFPDSSHCPYENIIRMSAELFEASDVNKLYLDNNDKGKSEIIDFGPWVDLVRKIRPSVLCWVHTKLTKELMSFLILAADYAKLISIWNSENSSINDDSLPCSLLKEILQRKCSYIIVRGNVTKIPQSQIEDFVRFFQHLDKKASISIPTESPPINNQVGEYRLKMAPRQIFNLRTDMLTIEHVHMSPCAEDMYTYYE